MTKKKAYSQDWAREFQDFVSAEAIAPPVQLSDKFISKVKAELDPSNWHVFSKLALIHFVVGALMLTICPQFGISLFDGMGLMALFMRYGETVCTIACGVVFLGGSALAASFVLSPEEIRKIRKTEVLQLGVLALLSVGVFICLGATVVATLGVAWVVGSTVGGLATFEMGWRVRSYFRRRLVYGG
jgi:hypothetical protein